jgi:metallo-beta-lactamase family protein
MDVRIKFLGASGTVTGSRYLLEVDGFRFLFDCGLFQGDNDIKARNWEDFPVDPLQIDCVVLSHAHIDHTGYLPKLFKEGFAGSVHCTEPTGDLLEIMLLDAARLQEEETAWAIKKGYSRHPNPKPLYTEDDAKLVFPKVRTYKYGERFRIHDRIEIVYHDAGHLLGSAITEIFIQGDQQNKKLVFSGDLGRYNKPILKNPATIEEADILLIESTYGTKDNPYTDPKPLLAKIINETFAKNGVVLIPAFAVGRAQLVLYYLKQLMQEDMIPDVPVYLDSPMAINATYLYFKFPEYHRLRLDINVLVEEMETNMLVFCRTSENSRQINDLTSKAIIISSSGMMTGGRILHHLYHRLPHEQDTLLVVGYQGVGTRGRQILDGEEKVSIFGQDVDVKCRVEYIPTLSGHADRTELFQWMGNFKDKPKMTFTVHGEESEMPIFAEEIRQRLGWNVTVPSHMDSYDLFRGI